MSYQSIVICATGSIAISVIRFLRHKEKLILMLTSKASLFLESVMVIINICIVMWAKDASVETAIPYDIV